jgi:glycosyltransferase involved in cell wall biosynthesis
MSEDRCILISPDFPPPMIGGSLVYMQTLVQNSGEKFDILTGTTIDLSSEVVDKEHNVHRSKYIVNSNNPSSMALATSYMYMIAWLLYKLLQNPYKAIVVNPGVIGNSLLLTIGLLLKKKVIVIAYGEEITVPLATKSLKNELKKFLLKNIYKRASGIVTVCHFCRDILISDLNVESHRIDVIPSCLASGKANQDSEHDMDSKQIISVGRLIERKGFHLLIQSVQRLKVIIPEISLSIVGQGIEKDKIISLVRDNSMSDYVEIISDADDEKLNQLYSNSGLFVLANHRLKNGDTEGCPSVFSEAMAYGLPVIGGTGAGVDTAILDGENGFIVNMEDSKALDDSIIRILSDKETAMYMSLYGRKKLKRDHFPSVVGASFKKSINRFILNKPATGFQEQFNIKCPSLKT